MKIAVVGSRNYPDKEAVEAFVRQLPAGTTVISGGARGVDTWAIEAAKKAGLDWSIYYGEWETYGKRAGFLRNKTIVEAADKVVVFWDGISKGSNHTIKLAQKAGLPVEIIHD